MNGPPGKKRGRGRPRHDEPGFKRTGMPLAYLARETLLRKFSQNSARRKKAMRTMNSARLKLISSLEKFGDGQYAAAVADVTDALEELKAGLLEGK